MADKRLERRFVDRAQRFCPWFPREEIIAGEASDCTPLDGAHRMGNRGDAALSTAEARLDALATRGLKIPQASTGNSKPSSTCIASSLHEIMYFSSSYHIRDPEA